MLTYLQLGNISYKKQQYRKAIWYYEIAMKEEKEISDIVSFNRELAKKTLFESNHINNKIEIIIPVYNSLNYLQQCFNSLLKYSYDIIDKVIFINDSSDDETTQWIRQQFEVNDKVYLLENEINLGYTKSVNLGLKISSASYVVLLNSDTIVTKNWLENMLKCMKSHENVGIVGPLSNAAQWQSVPEYLDKDEKYMINELSKDISVDRMAKLVSDVSLNKCPSVTFINGFCFIIKREVIESIGYMDEENFPLGYGEETDYCIRAKDAGFELAIADNTYIYHAKSKSFGDDRREKLSVLGSKALKHKHTLKKYLDLVDMMNKNDELNEMRDMIKNKLEETR